MAKNEKNRGDGKFEKSGYRPLNEGYAPKERGYKPVTGQGTPLPKAPVGGTGQHPTSTTTTHKKPG
jgi:hypothetical protein